MTSHHMNFTKTVLDNLPPAEQGKRDYYYDNGQEGLMLQVTGTGAKTYYMYKRVNGRPERLKLGKYTEITFKEARGLAKVAVGDVAKGGNPQKERRAIRNEMTFEELFQKFIHEHAKKYKKSWKEDENIYRRYLTKFTQRRISEITRDDIAKLHTAIGKENGVYSANRSLALVRAVYNKAIEWNWGGQNPATHIKKFPEESRSRFLQPEELQRFFDSLNYEPNEVVRDFVLVSLFTGARKSNVLSMKWEDISFKGATWNIPDTKNGEPQLVPLADEVIAILKERSKNAHEIWVFPSNQNSEKHLTDPKKVWAKILDRAGIKDLRLHDLRRTMGSYQAIQGSNSFTIGRSLGHKSSRATEIYARLNLDPVRESMSNAVKAMKMHSEGE